MEHKTIRFKVSDETHQFALVLASKGIIQLQEDPNLEPGIGEIEISTDPEDKNVVHYISQLNSDGKPTSPTCCPGTGQTTSLVIEIWLE